VSDRFSLDDVMADEEFEGYYGDCLQLKEEVALADTAAWPVLTFEDLDTLQRRKVHIVAQFAKLAHVSSGPADNRIVTLSPKDEQARNSISFDNPLTQTADDDEEQEPPTFASLDPTVDPFAQHFYDENRDMIAGKGIIPVLCEIAAADDVMSKDDDEVIRSCGLIC
jgi:hypothetical protein